MNLEQAKKLADIAKYINTIGACDTTVSVFSGFSDCRGKPACMICSAVRGGLIDLEFAIVNRIDFAEGFSEYFGVTEEEAKNVLYHHYINPSMDGLTTGQNYYQACKDLFAKYSYSHLLNSFKSGSDICRDLVQKEFQDTAKDQQTNKDRIL